MTSVEQAEYSRRDGRRRAKAAAGGPAARLELVAARGRIDRHRVRPLPDHLRHRRGVQPNPDARRAPSANPVPEHVTLAQLQRRSSPRNQPDPTKPTAHFGWWYVNSIIIPGVSAIFSVLMGAMAAYAFARFRFKGRRIGMLTLLLIQMFPAFLSLVAIYADPAERRRGLPVRGTDEGGADPRLPWRSLRSEHLAHEGVLRHDPDGAGRIRARRRSDADADLLGRDPAPCRARAGGDHAHLLRLHAQRVRDRELRPARRPTRKR